MKLENVNCALCGGKESKVLFEAENNRLRVTNEKFPVVQCSQCGLVYTSPRPALEEMASFYNTSYYSTSQTSFMDRINHYFSHERVRYVSHLCSRGSLLDVGCGAGAFLEAMAGAGFDVHGIEPSDSARDHLPESVRHRVRYGNLASVHFERQSMDVITLWHVLEHLPAPLDELRQIHDLLKPDGTLIAEVPNFGSFEASWLRQHWFALDVPRHFWHFTPETLHAMALKAGFKKIKIESSGWQNNALRLTFLFSTSSSITHWMMEKFKISERSKILKSLLTLISFPTCLMERILFPSLPTMRLIASKQA